MQETSKKWPLVILSVLCLAFAGGGIYFFTENNKCNDKFKQLDNISTGCIEELRESGITGLTIGETKTPVSKKVSTPDVEFCTEETQLCLKYPSGWMVSAEPFEYTDSSDKYNQTINFYNQFGTKVMIAGNNLTGLGTGPCEGDPDDIKLTVLETHKLGFQAYYNNEDLYAVKAYYQEKDDRFFIPIVTIADAKALQTPKTAVNHSICDIEMVNIFSTPTAKSEQSNFQIQPALGTPADNKGFFFREEGAIKDWLKSGDGATIYEMLKTAYIKK